MKRIHLYAVLAGFAAFAILAADASAMYNPATGTWLQRDPGPGGMMAAPRIGTAGPAAGGRFLPRDPTAPYAAGMNLYQYVGGRPIWYVDPSGLFDEGINEGGSHVGHGDFTGNNDFDYNREDTDPETGPHTASGLNNPGEHHFRDMEAVEADIQRGVDNCDHDLFQRQAHNGQDWFSHREGLGYPGQTPRRNRMTNAMRAQVEHGKQSALAAISPKLGTSPDDTTQPGPAAEWARAEAWTQGWLDKWNKNCCRYIGRWTRRDKVPGGPACCDKDAAAGVLV